MSLLLDALHRASKDKEKAALAAAQAAAADSKNEGKVVLSAPATAAIDFPDLVPAPTHAEVPEPAATVALSLAAEDAAAPAPTASSPVPPPTALVKPMELALEIELEASAAVMQPRASVLETASATSPPAVLNRSAPSMTTEVPSPPTRAETGPKVLHPQAAAAAIQNAYAAPLFASKPPQNRRAMVLAGIAGLLGLAFASFMLGLWGDPEKLLGLNGHSSIAPSTPPVAAVVPAAQEAASAPVPVPSTEAPAQSAIANPAVATPALASAPGTVAVPAAPPLPPRATASAPSAPPGVAQGKKVAAPDEVVLRAAGTSPVFAARLRTQSVLEQGYAALLAGRLDDASRAYAVALESNPGEPDALLGLAYIAHTKGQREDAQNYYRKVLRQDPANSVAHAGLAALESGANGAPSSERAKELAARQPDSAAVQALAAAALVQEGALPDAALAFARAQALEPGNPLHAYNLAVAWDKLGNYAQAASQYDKAVRMSAGAPTPLSASQVQAAQLRAIQLRQSLGVPAESPQ